MVRSISMMLNEMLNGEVRAVWPLGDTWYEFAAGEF